MALGELIEDLILCNIKIWHTATQLKDINGKSIDTGLSAKEIVHIHAEARLENAKRSQLRYEIDKLIDSPNAVMDIKVNYLDEEKPDGTV